MRVIDFNDTQTSATSPNIVYSDSGTFPVYASDELFVTATGTDAKTGNVYFNSTLNDIRYYNNNGWHTNESELNNVDASDPTAYDDSNDGYEQNSIWINSSNSCAFICVDSTQSAAVWVKLGKDVDVQTNITDIATNASNLTIHAGLTSAAHDIDSNPSTTSNDWTIGDGNDTDKTIQANTGAANVPALRYNTTDDYWEFSNDGIAWSELGSGSGGGDADTIHLITASALEVSDIDLTGNNADFDGAGTITTDSLSINETAADLLTGDTAVITYNPDADGSDDYFGFTKAMPIGQRGKTIGVQFNYKNDSTVVDDDFRFCFKIKDGVNAGHIVYDNLSAFNNSDNTGTIFTGQYVVPTDCTEIEFGWQNTSTTTTVELHVNNILVSQSPFVYKDLINEQIIRYDGFSSRSGSKVKFKTEQYNTGDALITIDNTSYTKAIANRKVSAHFFVSTATLGSSAAIDIIRYNSSDVAQETKRNTAISSTADTNSDVFIMDAGDYLVVESSHDIVDNTTDSVFKLYAQAISENVVSPAQSDIEIIEFGDGNGHGSTNTAIRKYTTVLSNTLSKLGDYNSSDIATDGVEITAKKKVLIFAQITDNRSASASTVGFSVNSNQLTTAINSITKTHRKAMATSAAAGYQVNTAYVGILEKDDILRPHDDPSYSADGTTTAHLSIMLVDYYQLILSAIPTEKVAYAFHQTDSGTSGGTSSSTTVHTRQLNILNEDGGTVDDGSSFCTLDSYQLTVQPGEYDITGFAESWQSNATQIHLYDITNSAVVIEGESAYSQADNYRAGVKSFLYGKLILTEATTFELRHYILVGQLTAGLGHDTASQTNNAATKNKHAMLKFRKLK